MFTHKKMLKKDRARVATNSLVQKKSNNILNFEFVDNRPEAVAQRKLQDMANSNLSLQQFNFSQNTSNLIQRKIDSTKVEKSSVWKGLKKDSQGIRLIKDISKQAKTAYINNSATGPFYAEPITHATHNRLSGDVEVQIPINDKLEAKRKKTGYRLEDGNEQETDRSMIIAFHELGHTLHLLKNETPAMDNRIYHVVLRNGDQIVNELIPLEEVLNVGFRDNPEKNIKHHYYEMNGVYGFSERRGEDITGAINERIGNRNHKENDFRQSHGKGIRIGYTLPLQ